MRVATRRMSFSSSTRSTRGRSTSPGAGLGLEATSLLCSANFRSQRARGAPDQKLRLYWAGALQKQVRQLGQTSVRSLTMHEHQGTSMASKECWQLWQATS